MTEYELDDVVESTEQEDCLETESLVEAGTTPPHKSVLTAEVLSYLNLKPGGVYLDVTFGIGGHTRAILEAEPTCKVIAFDWDSDAIENFGVPLQNEFGDRLTLIWGNFALLYKLVKKYKISGVDGILADFGTSQVQIVNKPGLSVYRNAPLDMRMGSGQTKITATEVVNNFTESELRTLFVDLAQEKHASKIARAIVAEREKKYIGTVGQLVALIERVAPADKKKSIHPATKVFQALRIYVNQELENINSFLAAAPRIIKPHGRLVCISFHSLEDRLVKQSFKEHDRLHSGKLITPRVVTACPQELAENPSSRSARLRALEILQNG